MQILANLPRWPRLLWLVALAPAVVLLLWRRDSLALYPGREGKLFALLDWWGELRGP